MEYNQVKECRICLGDEGKLLSVCKCKGTQEYVHLKCINRWRFSFPPSHDRHIICNLCFAPYNIPEPFWNKRRVEQWVYATTMSLSYIVIPTCAIVSSLPCLSYQLRTLSAYYKPFTLCNFHHLGWIVAETMVPAVQYMVLTPSMYERQVVFSSTLFYLFFCFLVALFDVTGIFVWMCFVWSMTLPCWTCCILPKRNPLIYCQ